MILSWELAYELELRNCELSASLQHITQSHKQGVLEREAKEEEFRCGSDILYRIVNIVTTYST